MRKMLAIWILCLFLLLPNGTAFARWEYDVLDLPQTAINNQTPIKIAVIDSGIIDNDYLRPYVIQGYNFLEDSENCTDSYGHGTKVSGILIDLAKQTDLNVQLIPLKTVSNEGTSTTANVIKAISYAIEQKADIINISMSSKNSTPEMISAIQNAQANNIIIVAGAGNDGQNLCLYPASYDNVLSVGAIAENHNVSWFSNFNDKVGVAAPGEKITTMELDGSYGLHSGTSFSTPFVTFEIALIKSEYPELSCSDIMQVVKETSVDVGEIDKDNYFGNGIVNYKNALSNTNESLQEYKRWTPSVSVALNKPWTIAFNDLVKSVGNISIEDEYYNAMPINIQVNGSTVAITPLEPYKQDSIYSLTVKNAVSYTDVPLKKNIKKKFKTINEHQTMNISINNDVDKMPLIMP